MKNIIKKAEMIDLLIAARASTYKKYVDRRKSASPLARKLAAGNKGRADAFEAALKMIRDNDHVTITLF